MVFFSSLRRLFCGKVVDEMNVEKNKQIKDAGKLALFSKEFGDILESETEVEFTNKIKLPSTIVIEASVLIELQDFIEIGD